MPALPLRLLSALVALGFACLACDAGPDGDPLADAGEGVDASAAVDANDAGAALDSGPSHDAGPPEDAGVPADAGAPAAPWSDVRAVFLARCATSTCHVTNSRTRVVVTRHDAIVGVTAPGTQLVMVAPGEPERSLLYRKVAGTQVALCSSEGRPVRECGGVMPPAGRQRLTASELGLVERWIAAGALLDE